MIVVSHRTRFDGADDWYAQYTRGAIATPWITRARQIVTTPNRFHRCRAFASCPDGLELAR